MAVSAHRGLYSKCIIIVGYNESHLPLFAFTVIEVVRTIVFPVIHSFQGPLGQCKSQQQFQ